MRAQRCGTDGRASPKTRSPAGRFSTVCRGFTLIHSGKSSARRLPGRTCMHVQHPPVPEHFFRFPRLLGLRRLGLEGETLHDKQRPAANPGGVEPSRQLSYKVKKRRRLTGPLRPRFFICRFLLVPGFRALTFSLPVYNCRTRLSERRIMSAGFGLAPMRWRRPGPARRPLWPGQGKLARFTALFFRVGRYERGVTEIA